MSAANSNNAGLAVPLGIASLTANLGPLYQMIGERSVGIRAFP